MSSTWGNHIKLSIFGGSHTEAIGVVIDGLPAGETIDFDAVLCQMARRAPGRDKSSTPRKESDTPHILSGLLDGVLTGAPLSAVIENSNTRSKDYSELKVHPRFSSSWRHTAPANTMQAVSRPEKWPPPRISLAFLYRTEAV